MSRSEIHKKIHLYLTCAIAFLISFKFLVPLLIIALFLNWLLEGDFKLKFNLKNPAFIALLFISLYLVYLIGMLYTSNTKYGWADLQTKLSLLIFPILFFTRPLNKISISIILQSFVAGVLSVSIILLLRATYLYLYEHINSFYYVDFSLFLHPSYFGMYINFALLFILQELNFERILGSFIRVFILLFFTLIIFLLSSKLALICTLLIFISYGIIFILRTKKYKTGILVLLVSFTSFLFIIKSIPELDARIQNLFLTIAATKVDKTESESNAVRILVWNAAANVLLENGLAGVGTGDVKDELFKQYEKLGYTGALEHKLNAHNQFLQTGVAIGFMGLILLLGIFLIPIHFAWKHKNYLFVTFSVLIFINFLTESMLEAEAGVIFIACFQSLLFFRKKEP